MNGLIACVLRNGLSLTKRAYPTFVATGCDILLIDNASTDGTRDWMKSLSNDKLWFVLNHRSESLAAKWNLACKVAFYDFHLDDVLLVNNDIEIRPDTYQELKKWAAIDWLDTSDHGLVSCVSVRTREKLRYPEPPVSFSNHPDFSCFLLKKWAYEKIGPFDEDYFPAYFEDNSYHVRAHRKGVPCVSIDLPFVHHGASTILNADPIEKALIERGAERNRELFRQTYGCIPGTPEYDALFSEAAFGSEA